MFLKNIVLNWSGSDNRENVRIISIFRDYLVQIIEIRIIEIRIIEIRIIEVRIIEVRIIEVRIIEVRIIEVRINRGSDNRGCTVILQNSVRSERYIFYRDIADDGLMVYNILGTNGGHIFI